MPDAPRSLAAYLRQEKLSHRSFAKMIGVHETLVSMWIRGDRTPTLKKLKQLEAITTIPIARLFPHQAMRRSTPKPPKAKRAPPGQLPLEWRIFRGDDDDDGRRMYDERHDPHHDGTNPSPRPSRLKRH